MKKIFTFFALFIAVSTYSQTDYSDQWEDLFSYTNVKDFVKVDDIIYAVADNAIFTYNTQNQEISKLSSVNGLSGETISAIHYSDAFNRLVIGYETGLVEVVNEDGSIRISPDILSFNQSGSKSINDIYEYNGKLLLSTPFAVIEYDIDRIEFGDTYFIGPASSEVSVNEIVVLNDIIYAATETGIFTADANSPNLIDFNNWTQQLAGTSIKNISIFNNQLYTISGTNFNSFDGTNQTLIRNYMEPILDLISSSTNLTVTATNYSVVYDLNINEIAQVDSTPDFSLVLNTAFVENNSVFLGTTTFGILATTLNNVEVFQEIHPEGPINNAPFHIAAQENNLWVVYGGYNNVYGPSRIRQGFSQFTGEEWLNTPFNPDFPVTDMTFISIDPNDANHVFMSSMGSTRELNSVSTGGVLEVNDGEIVNFYNNLNSSLEGIDLVNIQPGRITIRIVGSVFDRQGNLWVTNIGVNKRLKKLSPTGQWSEFDLSEPFINFAFGMNEIVQDRTNNFWIGTRRNGVYVFNEEGNRQGSLTTEPTKGSLPNLNVRTVAVDDSNRIWLGTLNGLVVFNNAANFFDSEINDAEPIIILDDGTPRKLLGDETINTITVDGADNKWFGTENAGVLYTNPNGQTTLANFNTGNSPLPSNKIRKIAVDDSTGKVYFATDKGIVAYNSNVAPFGNELGEVYGYPNPALSNHETVTIAGRNGTNLPRGTNVKILDAAGNLVYETNVVEGQELSGGKVVWNKRNLAGNKVASGVYIVLLATDDASETSTTKIAIVN